MIRTRLGLILFSRGSIYSPRSKKRMSIEVDGVLAVLFFSPPRSTVPPHARRYTYSHLKAKNELTVLAHVPFHSELLLSLASGCMAHGKKLASWMAGSYPRRTI